MSDRLKLAMAEYQKLNADSARALIQVASLLAHQLQSALEANEEQSKSLIETLENVIFLLDNQATENDYRIQNARVLIVDLIGSLKG